MFTKQKEVFDKIYNERFGEIDTLIKEIDFNKLNCTYKSRHQIDFNTFNKPTNFYDQIKNSVIKLEFAKRRQDYFKTRLNRIKMGNKSEEQKEVLNNINNFYEARIDIIDLFDDFTTIMSEAKNEQLKKKESK